MNAQQLIVSHLLPIAGSLVLLWIAYRLLFRNSNRVPFNRCFLLTAMLFSLLLPLLGWVMGERLPQMGHLRQAIWSGNLLNEVVVSPDGAQAVMEVGAATEAAAPRTWNG